MTALVMDLGNTRWKLACAEAATIGQVTAGDYAAAGPFAAALAGHRGVDHVLLASVVDAGRTAQLVDAAKRILGLPVRRIAATDAMPNLVSGYRRPEQLGVDRLLGMVAARTQSRHALCVVDAGTAVTIDFVDRDGRHLGGFILPGEDMARACLFAHTAIPRDGTIDENDVLGRDTATAVALATRHAVAGIVERFAVGTARLFPGQTMHTVIGGGAAGDFESLLPTPCSRLDHMVLRGLAAIAAAGDG